jgi:hypothetical protein
MRDGNDVIAEPGKGLAKRKKVKKHQSTGREKECIANMCRANSLFLFLAASTRNPQKRRRKKREREREREGKKKKIRTAGNQNQRIMEMPNSLDIYDLNG